MARGHMHAIGLSFWRNSRAERPARSESSTSDTCPVLERDCPTPRKLGRGRSRTEVVSELGCAPHQINAEAIGAWAMDNNR